jgi:pimeloyl-ACP methyl ester carboxylesterase
MSRSGGGSIIDEGVGHYPMLEQPTAFNDLLAGVLPDFLRDQGRTR